MIRMSVVWAGCLLPVLTGCGSFRNLTGTDTARGPAAGAPEAAPPRPEVNPVASAAWSAFQERQPQPFSNEFHEGFLAGYTDYLTRGPAALPPSPPSSATASRKPATPGSNDPVGEYHHGFRYGVYVAMVGKRSGDSVASAPSKAPAAANAVKPGPDATTVVPTKAPAAPAVSKPTTEAVLAPAPAKALTPVPDAHQNFATPAATQWNTFPLPTRAAKAADEPPANAAAPHTAAESPRSAPQASTAPRVSTEAGRPVPPLPKPELPIIPPFNPDLSGAEKILPLPVPPDAARLPLPSPPRPAPDVNVVPIPVPTGEPRYVVPPVREPLTVPVPVLKTDLSIPPIPAPPVSGATVPLPALPTSGAPIPPILGNIPPVPFRPTIDEK